MAYVVTTETHYTFTCDAPGCSQFMTFYFDGGVTAPTFIELWMDAHGEGWDVEGIYLDEPRVYCPVCAQVALYS